MSEVKECIFCKIVKKELPATYYFESKDVIAIKNIRPVTPIHILIMPSKHIEEMFKIDDQDKVIIGEMAQVLKQIIAEFKLENKGYRLVANGGGANEIKHLHWHLMGPISISRSL